MKISVYLIARISKDAHAWTDKVCEALPKTEFKVFSPKDHNPWNKMGPRHFSREVFETDLRAMKRSHIGLMLPEYGCDCAWEAGWFSHSKKPLVVFVASQENWLRDWMVKGGVDWLVTTNFNLSLVLRADPILSRSPRFRIVLIDDLKQLGKVLKSVKRRDYAPRGLLEPD